MTNPRESNSTPGDLLRVLSRQTKKAFLVFCLFVIATVGWIVFAPKEYESFAKVYVRVGRENNTLDPSATTGQTVNIQQTLKAEINSMLEIIKSRETAELVAADVGVDAILANDIADDESSKQLGSTPSFVSKFKNWLSATKSKLLPTRFSESRESQAIRSLVQRSKIWSPKESNVIEISCKAGHPELAQKIAASWTDAFIKEHLRVTRTEGSLYFFVRQTEEIQARLLETEEKLKEIKTLSGLVSIEGQQKVLEDQTKFIRTRSLANSSLLQASQAKLKEFKTILKSLPTRIEMNQTTAESHQGWNRLREKLFDLQIREFELKSKYSATNPEVIAVVQQREEAEKIVAAQSKSSAEAISGSNPTYELFQQALLNEQAQVVSLLAEKQSLANQLQENLAEFKKLNENAIRISDLERQLLNLETSYRETVARLEQARTLEAMETANISSVSKLQHASFSAIPTGLGRLKTLLLGMFLGVITGASIAVAAEYFDRSFVTASQVEQSLDLPVLVSIPRSRSQFVEVS